MTASITLFANLVNATFPELDGNFASYTPLTVIPCVVSGTNALTLAPFSGSSAATPAIPAYQNYMQFSGVFASNGAAPLTASVGSLPFLNVYIDSPSGPQATTGSEAIQNNAFTLLYDSTLNSGAGGWHIYTGTGTFTGGTLASPLVGTTITANNLLSAPTLASIGGTLLVGGPASLTSLNLTGPFRGVSASLSGPATLTSLNVTGPASFASSSVTGISAAATLTAGSLASVTKLLVGASSSSLTRIITGTGTLAFSITPANATQDQTFALAGALEADSISLGFPVSPPTGAGFTGFMAAAGTVKLRLVNPSTVTIGAATITVNATALGFT